MPRKKKMLHGVFTAYVPKGATAIIDDIVRADPAYKEKQVWKYKYLRALSSLVERCQKKDDYYVPVSKSTQAGYLKCSNAACCKIYRNLLNAGLVKEDRTNYVKKEHSYEYEPVYEQLEVVRIPAVTLDKKTHEMLSADRRQMEAEIEKDEVLKKYYEVMKKITFCGEARMKFNTVIESTILLSHVYDTNSPLSTNIPPLHGNFVPADERNLLARNLVAVDRIINGDIRVTREDKESRIYSNITNLKRTFRKYLRLDGKPLIGLDIANSQPLLAAVLFRRHSEQQYGYIKADVLEYQALCESGTFYEHFMNINNIKVDGRQKFKTEFFASVFFMKEYTKPGKLKKQFIEAFPTCNEALVHFKGGYMTEKKQYAQFPVAMQRVEATLVVGVNMQLLDMGIPAVNIFDSLYVTSEDDYKVAKQLLREAFQEVGLNPKVKLEDYRQS